MQVRQNLCTIDTRLINKREFRNITQIGGNGNEKAFSEVENLVK
ncbi:hypothetical protein QKA_2909 [Clostridioides difficile DA00165]|nr:hypothetical protein QKA_2909 [Clostridioides difficile DA00165]